MSTSATSLMAAIDVGKGKIINHGLNTSRTEQDFLAFIKATLACLPENEQLVLLTDQLNTHMSVSLVMWVAEQIGFTGDLGTKGGKGILKNMKTIGYDLYTHQSIAGG